MATALKDKLAARQNSVGNSEKHRNLSPQKGDSLLAKKHISNTVDEESHKSNKEYYKKREKEKEIEYEESMEKSTDVEVEHYKESEKKTSKIAVTIIIIICAYLMFLIYGVINTNYVYNENNEVVPERVSYNEIGDLKEFQMIATQYNACRSLYEKVLLLDCRYLAASNANDRDELIRIAAEYWECLDTVNALTVQLNAMNVSSKYESIKSQLLTWNQTYIAVYLQNISTSITNQSETDLANAIEYRDLTVNGFQIIKNNLISMGAQVSGAETEISEITEWTPSKFVQEQSGGLLN